VSRRRFRLAILTAGATAAALAAALPVSASSTARARAAACSPGLAGKLKAASTAGAYQLITVVAPTDRATTGALELWNRTGGCWKRFAGPWEAQLGRSGVSLHHREGDGTTPEGAYGFGKVIFGVLPDPGVKYHYHQLFCGDWWDEDPSSLTYNTFVHLACGAQPVFKGNSEALWLSPTAYAHFVLIDYNASPIRPGAGSAIFLHVSLNHPTNGCVALPQPVLVKLLRWLTPSLSPRIVIGTAADIRLL
jgi:L,D-peptidoglycan transpeptidase YkuD (ErfK/YbiS/YcfS/YnhG family)